MQLLSPHWPVTVLLEKLVRVGHAGKSEFQKVPAFRVATCLSWRVYAGTGMLLALQLIVRLASKSAPSLPHSRRPFSNPSGSAEKLDTAVTLL